MLSLKKLPSKSGNESDSSEEGRAPGKKAVRAAAGAAGMKSPPGKKTASHGAEVLDSIHETDAALDAEMPPGSPGARPLTEEDVEAACALHDAEAAAQAAAEQAPGSPARSSTASISEQMGASGLASAPPPGSCASTHAPAAAGSPAEEYEGESDSIFGAVVFVFPSEITFQQRINMKCITEDSAFKAYAAVVEASGLDGIDLAPQNGISVIPGKPIFIYVRPDSAMRLAAAVPEFSYEFDQFTEIKFKVLARKFEKSSNSGSGFTSKVIVSNDYINREAVFFDVELPPEIHPFVTAQNITSSLRSNFIVFRGKRSQMTATLPDGSVVPLGDNFRTAKVNIVVKPFGKKALDFDYPELLDFYYFEYGQKKNISLKYRLGGCGSTMKAKIKELFCKKTHTRKSNCAHCAASAAAEAAATSSAGPSRPRFSKAESSDRRAQALAVLAASSGISKKHLVCKYYLIGKCNKVHEGKRCGQHHDARAASSITCTYGTKCKYSKCGYKHEAAPPPSPSATLAASAAPEI